MFYKSEGCKVITSMCQVPEHRRVDEEIRNILQRPPEF